MANNTHFWKVWLRENLLTTDDANDYVAEVSTIKTTLHNEDLARRIVAEGSEIKYDTLLSVLGQRDRIVRTALQEGSSVLDGVCQISPRITGRWVGANAKFDPAVHKITVDLVASSELRKSFEVVGVEVLGTKAVSGSIGMVTDTATGRRDGFATPKDDIVLSGAKIRVAGDDANNGVYLVNLSTQTRTRVERRLTTNDPKTVIARLPEELTTGEYRVEVVTQFSSSGTMLKAPRTIAYERTLYVGVEPPKPGGGGDEGEPEDPAV